MESLEPKTAPGQKSRSTYLPFALPDIGPEERDAVARILQSGWITTGPEVRRFEAEFARTVSAPYAVAVNSCTAALHLALEAVGLRAGDEVITSPYTFAATAEVIHYVGARPVFVDIDPRTFNLDPALLAGAVSARTRAIIPVHIAGVPADLDAISAVAARRRIPVIEDAAHAFPSEYHGAPIGGISEFTCFSFYATKNITTGEGGMICTRDAPAADRCRIMSLHGISRDAWKRYAADGTWRYDIQAPGFKYNMTDIAAALGLVQLQKARRMLERRAAIAGRYNDAFGSIEELEIPPAAPAGSKSSWHLYMLRLNLERLTLDRAGFFSELRKRNIGASVHFIPLHCHPFYRDLYGFRPEDFPCAYRESMREISLPVYSKMTDDDVCSVIDAVRDVAELHTRRLYPVRLEQSQTIEML